MDRRAVLKKTVVAGAAAGAAAIAAPAISQGKVEWRMVTAWPKNFPGLGTSAERLAQRITAMSGGRLTVKVYSAGELVPALQALDAVIGGSAEMCHSAAYYWFNKNPGLAFFTGVPYGMTEPEVTAWMRYLGGQEIWDEIYDGFGVQGFLSGNTNIQAGGWFRKELSGVDDLKGMRFRTPGMGGQVWQKLGASVTNLAAGDIFQALQTGALDAAEFVGPYNDLALGFYQIAKNYYFPSFIEPGMATEVVVNKSKYKALSPDLQEIIRTAAQAEYQQMSSEFFANDPRALRTLVDKHGVKTHKFPDSILEAGAKASVEVLSSIRDGDNALGKKAAESFVQALNLLRTRTELMDSPFVQAREKYFKL